MTMGNINAQYNTPESKSIYTAVQIKRDPNNPTELNQQISII